jgi:hypothetical protein
VLLQALDAEEFGADRFFPLEWGDEDGVGSFHFELPFRDANGHGERVPVVTLVNFKSFFP